MCMVSVVTHGWLDQTSPNHIPWTVLSPNPELAKQMLDVIALLEKLDKRMGVVECLLEKEQKAAFKKKLRARSKRK